MANGCTSIPPDVTDVSPVDAKSMVYVPCGPVIPRPLNVAVPEASVAIEVVPMGVPPGPLATLAEMVTPEVRTLLPWASRSLTAGVAVNGTLSWAVAGGAVTKASCVGAPAARLIDDDVAPVRPVELNDNA